MLERGQSHPGGKVPPAPKGLRRGCQGRQGDRSHRADPGDGHEPMRRFIRLRPLDDLTIQIRNLLVEPMKDRKSTRLNSSHVESSYAAFCSRKKSELIVVRHLPEACSFHRVVDLANRRVHGVNRDISDRKVLIKILSCRNEPSSFLNTHIHA